jgi:hypothetical protein
MGDDDATSPRSRTAPQYEEQLQEEDKHRHDMRWKIAYNFFATVRPVCLARSPPSFAVNPSDGPKNGAREDNASARRSGTG